MVRFEKLIRQLYARLRFEIVHVNESGHRLEIVAAHLFVVNKVSYPDCSRTVPD